MTANIIPLGPIDSVEIEDNRWSRANNNGGGILGDASNRTLAHRFCTTLALPRPRSIPNQSTRVMQMRKLINNAMKLMDMAENMREWKENPERALDSSFPVALNNKAIALRFLAFSSAKISAWLLLVIATCLDAKNVNKRFQMEGFS